MLAAAAVLGVVSIAHPAAQSPMRVLVQTELGDIVLEIDTGHAPNTAANFTVTPDRAFTQSPTDCPASSR